MVKNRRGQLSLANDAGPHVAADFALRPINVIASSFLACLAMTTSLIASYASWGMIFLMIRSSLPLYGRPLTIALARTSPIQGRLVNSFSEAVLMSIGSFLASALVAGTVVAGAGFGASCFWANAAPAVAINSAAASVMIFFMWSPEGRERMDVVNKVIAG